MTKQARVFVSGVHAGTNFNDDRYGSLWELVSPADGALRNIGFAWVEVAPGATSPMHLHRITEELYHIVSGNGHMTVDGITQVVEPGDTIAIPIGAAHAITAGDAGIGFICVTSPPYDPDDDHEIAGEGGATC